jgi:hypothetical protein
MPASCPGCAPAGQCVAVADVEALVERRRAASQGERRLAASQAGLFRLTPSDPAE